MSASSSSPPDPRSLLRDSPRGRSLWRRGSAWADQVAVRLGGFAREPLDLDDDSTRPPPGPRGGAAWWRPPVATLLRVLVVVGVGGAVGWWLLRPGVPPVETVIPVSGGHQVGSGSTGLAGSDLSASVPPSVTASSAVEAEIVAQASGAVMSPGVYRLPPGSRIDDLVRAAGGLTTEADLDRVNLAAPLADGVRIWVPRQGEQEVPEVVAGANGGPATGGGSPSSEGADTGPAPVVNLNLATSAELEALPGVGPATAAAIVQHREQAGPFRSVDDLIEVRGIGEAKLEQIRPQAVV